MTPPSDILVPYLLYDSMSKVYYNIRQHTVNQITSGYRQGVYRPVKQDITFLLKSVSG
jgi:hypothetical protein